MPTIATSPPSGNEEGTKCVTSAFFSYLPRVHYYLFIVMDDIGHCLQGFYRTCSSQYRRKYTGFGLIRLGSVLGSASYLECGFGQVICFSLNYQGITIYSFSEGVAPSVEAFDKLMKSMVAEFLKKSRILAGDVETHVSTFLPCFPLKG